MTTEHIDVLIRGARIIDGTGNPWYYGDVAISGERVFGIAPPGSIEAQRAREIVDATGMVVCPGFIDILSHSIIPLMQDPRDLGKITQGVTTEIMGEGWTPTPVGGHIRSSFDSITKEHLALMPEWVERSKSWTRFGHWLDAMMEVGVSPNVGSVLGGGTLREYVRGMDMGESSPDELALMRRVMAEAMEDGALGVSYALIYPPEAYASTHELVEVAKVVKQYGGVYVTHMRSEGDQLLEGIAEAVEIGRQADIPVEIYHLKAFGRNNWSKMATAIEHIQAARNAGIDVTADMYPYTGSGTGLDSVLPPWVAEGNKFYEKLADANELPRIRAETLAPTGGWEALAHIIGPEGVMPVGFARPENQQYTGKRLPEIGEMRGQHWFDSVIDLLISEQQRIFTIYFGIEESNLQLGLRQPWVTVSTDAGGVDPAWAKALGPTHPRAYGTYPRVLGKYVREEKLLTLEDAVRKMSGAVAARLGLRERGLLRKGFFADVVIFDPATVGDKATFEETHQLSQGIRDVWVNGTRVIKSSEHTGATPGRIVRR